MEIIYEALVMTNVQIKLKAFDILFKNPSQLFRLTAFLTYNMSESSVEVQSFSNIGRYCLPICIF